MAGPANSVGLLDRVLSGMDLRGPVSLGVAMVSEKVPPVWPRLYVCVCVLAPVETWWKRTIRGRDRRVRGRAIIMCCEVKCVVLTSGKASGADTASLLDLSRLPTTSKLKGLP